MPHPTAVFSFVVQPDHCNRMGNLHGGAAASLFDFCTTLPLALVSRPGFWQLMGVTRSLNVTYLRPAPCGEEFLIECRIVQIGRRLTTLHGVMKRRKDGQLVSMCEHGKVNNDPEPSL
ncbi:hypothetical protein CDD82_4282 [Ophiocordyceps australis]|uniref:Thioesterase domain-containing protein n=1 Tax=Ophiocordyceps australis TaxID=1399860 RepID=A0A2C5Z8S3_9HYPO|nr:hypothetical protein CDD82_4282 [Ophiocordyceps australis]